MDLKFLLSGGISVRNFKSKTTLEIQALAGVAFESEIRSLRCSKVNANFGFATPVQIADWQAPALPCDPSAAARDTPVHDQET
ncbi:hypothetical protein NKI95_03545 [Mesorhizobium sp. M0306]|uniref:hypothetical protein n=1 Tax=Mesorhizobium sp. M0306 TaxID=2956932 RepID=UPI00333A1DA9